MALKKRRQTRGIIIHHTVTPLTVTRDWLYDFFVDVRGFADIGYHRVVAVHDGEPVAYQGRGLDYVGAHCTGRNHDHLGIALAGNWTSKRHNGVDPLGREPWSTHPAVWDLLVTEVDRWMTVYGLRVADVTHHGAHSATECCGFDVAQLRRTLARRRGLRYTERRYRQNQSNNDKNGHFLT